MCKLGALCFVLFVITGCAIAITDENKAEMRSKFLESIAECVKDYPLSEEDAAAFKDKKFPEGENAGCFATCVFKKVGLFDENGSLSLENALENAKKVAENDDEFMKYEDFLASCAKVNDEDVGDDEKGCNRAKLAFNCFSENADKFGFHLSF